MPFNSTADYWNGLPAIQVGLQIGHQIAQQRYQDEATKIAERRTAAYEQEQNRLQAKQALDADKIAREMQAEADFQTTFKGLLNQELNALPPELRGDEKELNAANRRAYLKAIPYMPPGKLAGAMGSAMSQEASTQRTEMNVQGRLDALNNRLDSQEYIAELRNDAKAVSEDEYVNRHLNAHAKQAGLPMEQADADLRRIYRGTHGSTKKDDSAMGSPDPIADTLGQLERAKAAGVKRVKVTPDGGVQAVDPSVGNLWMGGDPIDDVIRKVERDATIKGVQAPEKKTAPAGGKSRVFQYDPKTGGIKK